MEVGSLLVTPCTVGRDDGTSWSLKILFFRCLWGAFFARDVERRLHVFHGKYSYHTHGLGLAAFFAICFGAAPGTVVGVAAAVAAACCA